MVTWFSMGDRCKRVDMCDRGDKERHGVTGVTCETSVTVTKLTGEKGVTGEHEDTGLRFECILIFGIPYLES